MQIKTMQAAILAQSGQELIIDEVTLPEQLDIGQVLVKIHYSGICGSQIGEIDAIKGPDRYLPHLLGHEGTGVVQEIGPGVTHLSPGQHVVLHWRPGLGIQSAPPNPKDPRKDTYMQTILITGGAGYVGAVLVPKLLDKGYKVRVLDIFAFGKNVFGSHQERQNLELLKGDLRDPELIKQGTHQADAVIHLACISNDPSFELNPDLGRSINYDAFMPLVESAKEADCQRFIYASSSSVYGIKDESNVTEDLELEPLTDYSKYKALCEKELLTRTENHSMVPFIIRPATVCGYSPRQRLDLTVNILTHHAIKNNKIRVFGGQQKRPNIHIQDMTDLYVQALEWPAEKVRGKIYNVGYENHKVMEIAEMVKAEVGEQVDIAVEPTDDHRSYHISSAKIEQELGFTPQHTIQDAIKELVEAFKAGKLPDSMEADHYYNIRVMKKFQELVEHA